MANYDEIDHGVDPNGNARRRSSISAFGSDGRGNFSETYAVPETGGAIVRQEWGADYDDALAQANAYAQMSAANRRVQGIRRHNAEVGRNSFLSALKIADQNGGRLPSQLLGGLNADLGFDGKTRAIYGFNRARNGDLVIDIAERDANGNMRNSRQVMDRMQVYGLKNSAPGLFDDADMDGERDALLNAGYRKADLPQRVSRQAYMQSVSRGAQMRQAQAEDAQMAKFIMGIAQDVMKSRPRDAEGAIRQKLLMDDKFRAELMRGKPIMEEDGMQKEDEHGNPMYEQATDEEMKQRLDRIVGLAMGGQAQGGGQDEMARKMQFVNGLLDRLYPKASQDPRMEEIRSRQMDNALEDQRAADVRRRPQQLVDYIEDGVWKRGNGYVVDGKVYDAKGREIAGAQIADRNGNPVQTQPTTQDGRDGGALLRQMQNGQPPTQREAEGTMQTAVQSQDNPVPAPNGERETTHNGKRYLWGWNEQQGRWAYNPVVRQEGVRTEEIARRRRNGELMRDQASPAEESEPPKLEGQASTNNSVPVSASSAVRRDVGEAPVMPEERARLEAERDERERQEAELAEQNRREGAYRSFMDEHGRAPTEDELQDELARLARIDG